ncbi:MAG: hypothetical protein ACOYLK_17745 [Sphingomonas sp.]
MWAIAGVLCALSFSADASAACLSKTIQGDVASVPSRKGFQRAAPTSKVTIVVADADAAAYSKKGFAPEACPSVDKDKAKLARDICATAAFGNEAVQARFTSVLGVPPRELCDTAKKAVGTAATAEAARDPAQP